MNDVAVSEIAQAQTAHGHADHGTATAIFMHMRWERLALKFAILIPPLALLILIGLMAIEGLHTFVTRFGAFGR
jgi:cytochrome c oxidase subunit 4